MHELNYLKRVPSESIGAGSRIRPLSTTSIEGSANSGLGSGASSIGTGGATTTFFPFLAPPHPHPLFFLEGQPPPSFLMFIIPQTTRMNTRVCTRRPRVEGQPVGVAIHDPRIRLTRRNVSGFATMKNVRPEMIEMINFSACFRPLHPHPQSLKRPMICFDICQQKNVQV
jgi:hypothetical protein